MVRTRSRLAAATFPTDKNVYQHKIEATDQEIDALVHELVCLMEEKTATCTRVAQPLSPMPSFG
jgi:hypothetical protein